MGLSDVVAEVVDERGWRVVRIRGEVDMATARHLETAVAGEIDDGSARLMLDMRGVSFVDSTGVTVLFRAHEDVTSRGGAFRVLCTPGPVRRVLEVSGIGQVIPVYDDHAAAFAE